MASPQAQTREPLLTLEALTAFDDEEDRRKGQKNWKRCIQVLIHVLHLLTGCLIITVSVLGFVTNVHSNFRFGALLVNIYGLPVGFLVVILQIYRWRWLKKEMKRRKLLQAHINRSSAVSAGHVVNSFPLPSYPPLLKVFAHHGLLPYALLYQVAGALYAGSMLTVGFDRDWYYRRSRKEELQTVAGCIAVTVWSVGLFLMVLDILARAFGFTEWVWDREDQQGGPGDDDDKGVKLEESDAGEEAQLAFDRTNV